MPADKTTYAPVRGGIQIHTKGHPLAGTLGIVLLDNGSEDKYLVTAQHIVVNGPSELLSAVQGHFKGEITHPHLGNVIASWNDSVKGDGDFRCPTAHRKSYTMGVIHDFVAVKLSPGVGNAIDNNMVGWIRDIGRAGPPISQNDLATGFPVRLRGARTGQSVHGKILSPKTTINHGKSSLVDVITIGVSTDFPHALGTNQLTQGGDSGAIVVSEADNRMIGILQGILNNDTSVSVVHPIERVLNYCMLRLPSA
ncbi:MAG: hypothetical protein J0I06_01365 [Planctomycetes bacterium]|nr:hypothetical protein [Planctomycetota bacterium]